MYRQIARYLPHHRSENASKTHPKSSHDKFKTASKLFLCVFASLRSIFFANQFCFTITGFRVSFVDVEWGYDKPQVNACFLYT